MLHRTFPALAMALTAGMALCGCAGSNAPMVVPYVPPSYYSCIEVTPDDLLKAYTINYGNIALAEQQYTGQMFVFKKIRIDKRMLLDKDTFGLDMIIFSALEPGSVAKLRDGETIDIVGINRGMLMNYPGWLKFTDCIFLPTGSVQLPALGSATFAPVY